jgi:toxin-antitoxin system PIN domain toxin
MALADSNIWIALAFANHEFSARARQWLSERKPTDPALFCRATQQSFLRLLTTRALTEPFGVPALTNNEAWTVYEGFQQDECIGWVDEPRGLESKWKSLAAREAASPKLWMDAYLAAFAIAAGEQLVTTDRGFKKFKGLDVLVLSNP